MPDTAILIAMGQMLVVAGDSERNLARACSLIAEAAERECDVLVLPECLDLGWLWPDAPELAQPIPGAHTQRLCAAAARHRIHVVAGLTERDGERTCNSAVLIGPDGALLGQHRKINELVVGQSLYALGTGIGVVETAIGTIGLAICADLLPGAVALGHALGHMRAQVILSPAAWAVAADHDPVATPYGAEWRASYRAIAERFGIGVVGVSNVGEMPRGPAAGRPCIGCSLAVGPNGEVLAQGPYGRDQEALLVVRMPLHQPGTRHWGARFEG